jgi:hypothetical protein
MNEIILAIRQAIYTNDQWADADKKLAFNLLDLWEAFASVTSEDDVREMLLCYVQGARALEALEKLKGEG